ncbi:MAG TPA: ATP-binding protein [Gaiellaceae bacterium]|nr:ATP-binding protein [Gaiellaceae bacterium]
MNRLPIRLRLTLVFALVMAIVLALLGGFLYYRLGSSLDERIADDLESRSATLAELVRAGDAAGLEPALLRGEEGVVQVIGPDGASLLPSDDPVLAAGELELARHASLRIERAGFRLRADPVRDSVVVVGESLEDRDEALDALLRQMLIALPLALLASSAIGYVVAGAALRPVEAMRRRAAEISSDTPERRLPLPRASDEIRRLGETLNEMLARLDAGLTRERRFVADASHELRTPLASLRTELELVSRRARTQAELESALHSASEEVERLVRLAEALLVLARADDGELGLRVQRHSASDLLDAVARRNRARSAACARELVVSAPRDLDLRGDRERLEQALDGLVDNALLHGGGAVYLDARAEDGSVVLAVSDEGDGFATGFLPHAFERFSRSDAARTAGGTGLGLAIVDAIARAHGGSAQATNGAGGGAHVWIVLPSRLNDGDAARGDSGDLG